MPKRLKLKPSARDKRRYFLTSAPSTKVETAILEHLGTLGLARAAYKKVTVNGINKTVGSCLTKSLNDVRAALAMDNIKIDRVSGTIKGLRK